MGIRYNQIEGLHEKTLPLKYNADLPQSSRREVPQVEGISSNQSLVAMVTNRSRKVVEGDGKSEAVRSIIYSVEGGKSNYKPNKLYMVR